MSRSTVPGLITVIVSVDVVPLSNDATNDVGVISSCWLPLAALACDKSANGYKKVTNATIIFV